MSLNPAQREAVEHVHGPLLVLAGAGSGKTRVLTARIAALIDRHGVPPDRIFAVTFTNKAAGEMKHRIGQLLRRDPSGLWIGTFHSLSARLLRREAELLGFTRGFTIYDEDDRLSLIKRLMEQRGHSVKMFPPRAVQAIISAAKNRMVSPSDAGRGRRRSIALPKWPPTCIGAMGPALKAANAMDFDDLLLHPLTLFREHPDRLRAYQQRFSFILVDEFQDTNKAQYELIRLLGAHGNVCAVGDDDQSIYGWRGADVRNMQDFLRDFEGARLVRLEENYRSTQIVLDAANGVIAENSGRIGKTLTTRRRGGETVTLLAAADERDEAEWVVRELERRSAAGDWQYAEMAVLYRTNSQSRALEEAFRRAGIPYRLIGAISFYERREVKDLLAYLRLVANPADDEAFLRAVARAAPRSGRDQPRHPRPAGGAVGEAAARDRARRRSRAGSPSQRARGVPELRRASSMGFGSARAGFLRPKSSSRSSAASTTRRCCTPRVPEGADRWENVRELIASAADWSEEVTEDAEGGTPLERFLAEAALLTSADSVVGNESGVTLMTLHTAKGLEWPVVVLTGLEHGLFPLARAEEQPDGLEEERRLCYVGLTRAKDKLYLTWARARRRGGELRPGIPSRFLRAIPPGIVEERRTTSLWAPDWGGAAGRRDGARGWGSATSETGRIRRRAARRPAVPPEDEPSQDAPRYVKGERVRHRRFGGGTIQGLTGTGRDLKVTVAFDDEEVGVKQLLVAYAGLEREWESA